MIVTNLNARAKKLVSTVLMAGTLIFASCGDGTGLNPEIAGIDGPTLTLNEDYLLISVVFENLMIEGGLRYQIPEYQQSYVEISPDLATGGIMMAVNVSLQDVFENAGLTRLDRQKLPGGRNLPGVPSGSLPAVAFSIESFHNMAIYLGPEVFGIFFPMDTGIDLQIASFRFHVGETAVGNISVVGRDENGLNSGVLLLMDITRTVERTAKRLIRKHN